ncbi:MAG: TetR family transcriptional regulator C-terminal domain-containing protein, partial [Paracoccaceae bacterium]
VWFAFFGEAKYRASYREKIAEIDSERIRETERLCGSIKRDGRYSDVDPIVVTKNLEGLYDGLWLNILLYPKMFSRTEAKVQIRDYLVSTFPKHFSARKDPVESSPA